MGFDWKFAEDVLDKVIEEAQELKAALNPGNPRRSQRNWGTSCSLANFSRHIDVDPEEALRNTIDRFTARFEWVETALIIRMPSVKPRWMNSIALGGSQKAL